MNDTQDVDTTEADYKEPERAAVKGPLSCEKHGRAVQFVFVYATRTYHHVHKNGGLCSAPVTLTPFCIPKPRPKKVNQNIAPYLMGALAGTLFDYQK
jgi:hypothetical protein